MTDASFPAAGASPDKSSLLVADERTRKRNAAERRFRAYGLGAILISIALLVILMFTILTGGIGSFRQTYVEIPVTLDAAQLDKSGNRDPEEIRKVLTLTYGKLIETALQKAITDNGITIDGLTATDVGNMISKEAPAELRNQVLANPELVGQTIDARLLSNGRVDGYYKGRVTMETAARDSNTSVAQLQLADALKDKNLLATEWNWSP